jgi:hypothetical protein
VFTVKNKLAAIAAVMLVLFGAGCLEKSSTGNMPRESALTLSVLNEKIIIERGGSSFDVVPYQGISGIADSVEIRWGADWRTDLYRKIREEAEQKALDEIPLLPGEREAEDSWIAIAATGQDPVDVLSKDRLDLLQRAKDRTTRVQTIIGENFVETDEIKVVSVMGQAAKLHQAFVNGDLWMEGLTFNGKFLRQDNGTPWCETCPQHVSTRVILTI